MKKTDISFASSISYEKNYDSIDTLLFCKKNGIKHAQLFMDAKLMNDKKKIVEISEQAKESNISLMCHAPTPLNSSIIDEKLLNSVKLLLKYEDTKKLIVHFDPKAAISDIMITVESLNSSGITVCLENFYPETSRDSVLQNISFYNIILTLSAEHEFDLIPVIDFPRLFIDKIASHSDSFLLTELILDTVAAVSEKVILHLIDYTNNNQERDGWVAFGEGIMPYKKIFNKIHSRNIIIEEAVFEYESKELALKSLDMISNY